MNIAKVGSGAAFVVCVAALLPLAARAATPTRPPASRPTAQPYAPPSATPSPTPYILREQVGSCGVSPAPAWCSTPESTPTSDHPWVWWGRYVSASAAPWTPEKDGAPTSPAPVIVYTSTDGYNWVLRPGQPE